MVLPLVFSFLNDGSIYGRHLQRIATTQGAHYRLLNVKDENIQYFKKLENEFDVKYENGIILLTIKDEIQAKKYESGELNREEVFAYQREIFEIFEEIGDTSMVLGELSKLYTNDEAEGSSSEMTFAIGISIFISMLVIQATYRIYIGKFSHEIGVLTSIGASKKHILKIFFIKLMILFVFSGVIATVLSYIGMYALFHFFLQVNSSNFTWMVFNVNWVNTGIIFVILLLFLLIVFSLTFINLFKKMPLGLLVSSINDESIEYHNKTIKTGGNSVIALVKIFLSRSNKSFFNSVIISVPIIIIICFLFNYANVSNHIMTISPEYDIYIRKMPVGTDLDIFFTDEEINFLKNINGIENLYFERNADVNEFLVKINFVPNNTTFVTNIDGETYLQTRIKSISSISKGRTLNINEGSVILNQNHIFSNYYKINDTLNLYIKNELTIPEFEIENHNHEDEAHEHTDECNHQNETNFAELISFTISGFLEDGGSDGLFVIYLNETDYVEIMKEYPYNSVEIIVDKTMDYESIANIIKNKFNIPHKFSVTDERQNYQILENGAIGIYILVEIILIVLSSFIIIILYAFLNEYIIGQNENINLLYILGASKRDIYNTYLLQSGLVALFTLILSVGIGFIFSNLFFTNTGYYILINNIMIITYLILSIIIILSFLFPVHIGLKNQLKKL